jgi:hypothetical protein
MHKETRTIRASRFKFTIIGISILLFAGFLSFILPGGKSTTASLKVLGSGTNQSGAFVLVQFSNAGPNTITYWGAAPNQPRIAVSLGMGSVILPVRGFALSLKERSFEVKPGHSIDFEVPVPFSESGHVCQVTLSYTLRDPFKWLRDNAPYQISRLLPRRPKVETAATPFLKSKPSWPFPEAN